MKASRHRVRVLRGLAVLFVASLAMLFLAAVLPSKQRVMLSNGSCFVIRRVTCGKNNVYWHHPVRRAAAAVLPDMMWNQAERSFPRLFSTMGTNSGFLSQQDNLVVFGEFYPVSGGKLSWEFTAVDGGAKESGPLETDMLLESTARTAVRPCILAYGENVPNRWPIAVRIYERDTSGKRQLLAEVPAKRAQR